MAYLGDIPAPQLWKNVIDTREKLAAANNAAGKADSFVVPAGLNRTSDGPNGGNTGNVLAANIAASILGLPTADIHKVKRGDMNNAIAMMNTAIQQLTTPATTTSPANVSSATQTSGTTATPSIVTPTTATPIPTTSTVDTSGYATAPVSAAGMASGVSLFDPSSPYFPYILGAGVIIAMIVAKKNKKRG